ncbi:hypothetical protein PROFUN_09132 [Planoprotostelium fungivorum]|uniref:Uncharacterized protein n=1 Tax=Planoprotostelium fungivorum TaxID=1890364 RepID=A0A2P6NHZ2_9EUKA|nr:hypothetical protein PROFUN_09132 [Planoprotostelium fungivorum]
MRLLACRQTLSKRDTKPHYLIASPSLIRASTEGRTHYFKNYTKMSDAQQSAPQTQPNAEPRAPAGPLRNPLLNRVGAKKERKHFDSADWAMQSAAAPGQDKK